MKKRLLFAGLATLGLVLASCGNNTKELDDLKNENTTLKNENDSLKNENDSLKNENDALKEENEALKADNSYEVKYYDYLGAKKEMKFKVGQYNSVLDSLKAFTNVESSSSQYGTFINGIDNSFTDNNWTISIYENGISSQTGIDGLVIDAGDVFEFKHECWSTLETGWGSFDSYDVLVDQVVYNFAYTRFEDVIKNNSNWKGSNYWEYMALYKMINAKNTYGTAAYDQNIFNTTYLNNDLIVSLAQADVNALFDVSDSSFNPQNIFKYYYTARLLNMDLSEFEAEFEAYIPTLLTYGEFDEYTIPFLVGVAVDLGVEFSMDSYILNPTYRPASETWGPDGYSWLLTGIAATTGSIDSAKDNIIFNADILENSYSKDVSVSSLLLPLAATNNNARTYNDFDVIKYLFDNYYDSTTMKFTTEAGASDYSSNQIYAALVAYKIQRDSSAKFNLFV